MSGFFGNMFDFNGDGQLDGFEQAADLGFFAYIMEEEEKRNREDDDDEYDD